MDELDKCRRATRPSPRSTHAGAAADNRHGPRGGEGTPSAPRPRRPA
jgi:hypothetical protein